MACSPRRARRDYQRTRDIDARGDERKANCHRRGYDAGAALFFYVWVSKLSRPGP
jgi:hypothetical protein